MSKNRHNQGKILGTPNAAVQPALERTPALVKAELEKARRDHLPGQVDLENELAELEGKQAPHPEQNEQPVAND